MNNPKRICILAILCAVGFFCLFSLTGIEATSVQVQHFEQNTNRPGNDYRNFDLEQPGPGSLWGAATNCQLTCQNDPRCRVWTYVKPGVQGPKARCWLKDAIPAARANNCCASGVVIREFEPNTDRPGNDYSNFDLQAPDSNACQAARENQAWSVSRARRYLQPLKTSWAYLRINDLPRL